MGKRKTATKNKVKGKPDAKPGATMDGPTPPEHANLTNPPSSVTCAGCSYVYAGRPNCPNCGYDA